MPRYKLTIEYDGTPFVGWQAQDNGISVQAVLTDAIAAFTGARVAVGAAGRTDAGVHALGQVAHVDLAKDWECETVRDAINFHLRPQPVVVLDRRTRGAGLRRPVLRRQTALPLSHRQPPRRPCARSKSRLARAAPAECRSYACRRTAACRPSRLHYLPLGRVPGQIAGEDARSSRRRAHWRGDPH